MIRIVRFCYFIAGVVFFVIIALSAGLSLVAFTNQRIDAAIYLLMLAYVCAKCCKWLEDRLEE